jgi:hypothetical protein
MHAPRLPDWLVYSAIVLALLFAALGRRERADAPPPPPPLTAGEGAALGQPTPFDPAVVVRVQRTPRDRAGAAFSVGDGGVWVTARHVVEGCPHVALLVSRTQGVEAKAHIDVAGEAAVLTTVGGAPALPLATAAPLRRGTAGYMPGFPHDRPGEVAARLLGRERLYLRGRQARDLPVLVWAEIGRTEGLSGPLVGLSGAPALDGEGRVVGVTVAESPRRGRIYTTTPEALRASLVAARTQASPGAAGLALTQDNYGLAADALRRDLRVAEVVCLGG